MALPFDQLIEPLTTDDVEGTALDVLAAVGVNTTAWSKDNPLRVVIGVLAVPVAGLSQLVAYGIKSLFRETAAGDWLTARSKYGYGVDRIEATFAAGAVTLTNAEGGSYDEAAGDVVLLNTTTGATYRNTEPVVLGPFEEADFDFEAVEAGSASSATSGQIDDFVTPLLGVTCTNAAALIGTDQESDPDLRQRDEDKLGALSSIKGVDGSYKYFAKTTTREDGTPVAVNRVQVVRQNLIGAVFVYVASASGEISGDTATEGTDLYLVNENVQDNAVTACVTCTVDNATPVAVTVGYTAYADASAGATAVEIKAAIDAALTTYFATYPIGGKTINATDYYLFLPTIRGVITRAHTAIIQVNVTNPIADVELEPYEFASLTIAGGASVSLVDQ